MLEFTDFSNRRGALVGLQTSIYNMQKDTALQDKLSLAQPPEHIISWMQKTKASLLDINRRFLVAMDGKTLAGILFYRYQDSNLYLEDFHIAWGYRSVPQVAEGLLLKLQQDSKAKDATFFASSQIKTDADTEILASVGFKPTHENGWENLGNMSTAIGLLKLRYNR